MLIPLLPPLARVAAMVAIAPGFNFGQVPAHVRAMLAFALATVVAPLAPRMDPHAVDSPEKFLAVLISEVVIGAIIGLAAALVMEAASYAASLIELQAGLRAGEIFDPAQAEPSSLICRLYYLTAVIVFFCLNGHHMLIVLLCLSLQALPPGHVALGPKIGKLAVELVSASFWLTMAIALPTMAALLLTDVAFGLVGRVVSNFNVFFVGLPAKLAITILGMAVSAPALAAAVAYGIGAMVRLASPLCR